MSFIGNIRTKMLSPVLEKVEENSNKISEVENNLTKILSKTINRQMIQHLDYHLTTHCNLNCKGCSTFSPIAKEWFAEVNSCREDMKALHAAMGGG